MEQAIERYLAVTLRWSGRPIYSDHATGPRPSANCTRWPAGAFVNGGLSLVSGAVIVAGHGSWAWPGTLLNRVWLGTVGQGCCQPALPEKALRSMELGSRSPRGFVLGGVVLLAIGGWACYCLWSRP